MNGWGVIQWQAALSIVETLAFIVMVAAAFYLRSTFASKRELGRVNELYGEGLEKLKARVAACEQRHASAPDPGRVTEMALALERATTSISALSREMEALDRRLHEGLSRVDRGLDRIEGYLMNGGPQK